MKQLIALLCLALLAACGSGNTSPSITDIQAKNLNYGITAEFDFFGNNLASLGTGIVPVISNCSKPTPAFMSLGEQVFSCTVTATGNLEVQVQDQTGAVIATKSFTVPAPQVELATTMGKIVVELNPTAAPLSVDNFLNYVQTGFYAGTLFHRVIAGFVVQGGGYTSGLVAKPAIFAPVTLESNNGLTNLRGTIALARTADPNSATSQFFFNLADNPTLDYQNAGSPGYAVFGKIVQGLDVMDAIGAVPTTTVNGIPDVPVNDVTVTSATRTQ
ncbi:MAG TPA: peptidylprolyl isomerase [Rhodocyclaceae bacterium]|nr:peptidylprolyl isomerase [Rhodocyclaceae bacterium]